MKRLLILALLALATPCLADESPKTLAFGNDVYSAGRNVTLDQAGKADIFATGEIVTVETSITGSAHLSGRRVTVNAPVGDDLYAAGADVTVSADVAGSANLAGYDLSVSAPVGGNLRAAGRHIRLDAPVTGSALLAGGTVTLNSVISGDVILAAEDLEFGPEARIDGDLQLWYDGDAAAVPESVAPSTRISEHALSDDMRPGRESRAGSVLQIVAGLVLSLIGAGVLAALVASAAPHRLEHLGDLAFARPFHSLFAGFVTQSCLVGAGILLILTVVGILIAPVLFLMTAVLGLLGYLIAVYLTGRLVWNLIGQLPPDTFLERLIVALVGALALALIGLIPLFGWIALPVLSLIGLGALSLMVLRPEFRAD